jgi:hypothetical protein
LIRKRKINAIGVYGCITLMGLWMRCKQPIEKKQQTVEFEKPKLTKLKTDFQNFNDILKKTIFKRKIE